MGMEPIIGQPDGAGAESIVDGSEQTFAADVIEASMQVPVIVDFWAPWCGPCKQLTPALEKAVTKAKGKVKLVKIDVDQSPTIAQQLQIQSVPTVYGFVKGRPVDGFMGAKPESELKDFIDRLIKMNGGEPGEDPVEQAMEQAADAEKAEDYATAAAIYSQVVQHDPENVTAMAKLAHVYVKLGEIEAAQEILNGIPDEQAAHSDVAAVRAALELAGKAGEAAQKIDSLKAKVDADPKDHQARFELAEAQAAVGENEEAVDNLLHILMVDKGWNDGAARLQLLKVFEALGPTDPVTISGRRRLSSLLFS